MRTVGGPEQPCSPSWRSTCLDGARLSRERIECTRISGKGEVIWLIGRLRRLRDKARARWDAFSVDVPRGRVNRMWITRAEDVSETAGLRFL